jgi:hypothetical protein
MLLHPFIEYPEPNGTKFYFVYDETTALIRIIENSTSEGSLPRFFKILSCGNATGKFSFYKVKNFRKKIMFHSAGQTSFTHWGTNGYKMGNY